MTTEADRPRNVAVAVLRGAALFGARRPWTSILIAVVLAIAAAVAVPNLHISTSRTHLVSDANPDQRRLVAFYDRFGYPDAPVVVLRGGTAEARRALVDDLVDRLSDIPALDGRVLARITPEVVAERLLLEDPVRAAAALEALGPDVPDRLAGGVSSWIERLSSQLQRGLDDSTASEADARAGLAALRSMLHALDDRLAGRPAEQTLAALVTSGASRTGSHGLDDRGYLVGDGERHVIVTFPALASDEGDAVGPLVRQIRATRDGLAGEARAQGVEILVTGLPALVTDELSAVEQDLVVTSVLSTIGIAASLYFAFRSIRQASVSFLPIGFGTLVTMGAAALVFGRLNLITASFTSVLLGLGDFGVHIQARFAELMRGGADRKTAVEQALVKAGPGLLVGTLVTAAAFLTTTITEFTAFAQLGLLTCLGLLVMLVATYLVIAPMMMLFIGKKPKVSPEIPGMRALARGVRRFPRAILAVSVVTTLGFGVCLRGIDFNGRYFELLPAGAESVRGLAAIEHDRLLSPITASVSVASIEEARALAEELRVLDTVGYVETPSDLLPVLDAPRRRALEALTAQLSGLRADAIARAPIVRQSLDGAVRELADTVDEIVFATKQAGSGAPDAEGLKAAVRAVRETVAAASDAELAERVGALHADLARLLAIAVERARTVSARGGYAPEDVPALWRSRFVSKDGAALALYVHPRYDAWDPARSEAFVADVRRVAPDATGIATTLAAHPKMIVRGFAQATGLAALLVVAVLFVSFRNARDMAVAAVPLVMGAVWMLGSMAPLGIRFNHANMIVLPLLLGLGVDAGVHLMVRVRQSAEEHGGVADLDEVLTSTGGGVLIASLTTIFGFAVMLLASYRGMVSLGALMMIGMSAALLLTLVALPAILVVTKRAR